MSTKTTFKQDGKTLFVHIRYSNDRGKTLLPDSAEQGKWVGQYVDFTQADSKDPRNYTWRKFCTPTVKVRRGGERTGAGAKPKDPDGEAMTGFIKIRATTAQQADAKIVGTDAIRAFITKAAAKLRKEGTR